jgi:hypothetical protein
MACLSPLIPDFTSLTGDVPDLALEAMFLN